MINRNSFHFLLSLGLAIAVTAGCNQGQINYDGELYTEIDSVSYSMGYQNAQFLAQQGFQDIDPEIMAMGMYDALNERDSKIAREQMMAVIQGYQQQAQAKASQRRAEQGKKNREGGQQFLRENRERNGVMTTESGLQYEVLKEGEGPSPGEDDVVVVHYEGTLIDGTVFDSSHERGEPAEFPLTRVITGWTEGLQLMQEGSTYKFYIPSELAYGQNPPQGSPIEPNAVLIFEVELLEVKQN